MGTGNNIKGRCDVRVCGQRSVMRAYSQEYMEHIKDIITLLEYVSDS